MSPVFNESLDDPGMIRLSIEGIFAYIFNKEHTQFVINFQYIEINNEQVFDLLADGQIVENLSEITSQKCCTIDGTIEMKKKADKFRLMHGSSKVR